MTFSRDVQVGSHRAVMVLDAMTGELTVSWSRMPDALSENELAQYMTARNRFMNAYAPALNRHSNVLRPYCRATWMEGS
jgi:hypothetical protein